MEESVKINQLMEPNTLLLTEMEEVGQRQYMQLNGEQKRIVDSILQSVDNGYNGNNCIYIYILMALEVLEKRLFILLSTIYYHLTILRYAQWHLPVSLQFCFQMVKQCTKHLAYLFQCLTVHRQILKHNLKKVFSLKKLKYLFGTNHRWHQDML